MSFFAKFPLLAIVAICLVNNVASQTDDTIRDGVPGKDVVDAVIRRIEGSQIFSADNSFLIRLAYVESYFGTANHTFRSDFYGGIWQVDESVFRITQTNHTRLINLHTQIQTQFNINWHAVSWRRLMSPLYSGLAAALYFARVPEPIPQTIPLQAAHWKKYYRPLGELSKFEEDSEDLRNRTRCRGKLDFAIVMDSSGSINQQDPDNYERATNFTGDLIESFSLDFTRIGMLVYSADVRDVFEINNTLRIEQMSALARAAPFLDSTTRTDLGILRAIEMFNNTVNLGGVPKVMIVLTDGNSDRDANLTGAVGSIIDNGIKSIAIGIGNSIDVHELRLIALNDTKSVFQLGDFGSLHDFLFELTSITCEIPQKPVLNGTYADSLQENEKRIYEIEIPPVGLTIEFNVTVGQVNGYWSYTEEVPSSAVNDGVLSGFTYIPAPATSGRRMKRQAEEDGATVFFAIQGVGENNNNYTISAIEGGEPEVITPTTTEDGGGGGNPTTTESGGGEPPKSSTEGEGDIDWSTQAGAGTMSLAGALIIGLMSSHLFLHL